MNFKLVSSLTKVLPVREPETWQSRALSGLLGETLSFQLAYTCDNKSRNFLENVFSVEVASPLAAHITIRRVANVAVQIPYTGEYDGGYLVTEPCLMPDLLTEVLPHRLKAIPGQWRALWISIALPDDLSAGDYPVRLIARDEDGKDLGEHTVTISAIPAKLPEQRLIHTEWIHTDCLATYYNVPVFSEEHWRIIENFVVTAVENGINMLYTPLFTPPLDTDIGTERPTVQLVDVAWDGTSYAFGFDRLKRWVEMALRCGMRYFEMSHFFTQWGAEFTPKIIVSHNGAEIQQFGWHVAAGDARYRVFIDAFFPALTDFLSRAGIAENTFFHISDEPEPKNFADYMHAKELISAHVKGFRQMDAISNFEFYESGLVETPVCATNEIAPFIAAKVSNLWAYYCTGQHLNVSNRYIAMPAARTRMIGIQLYLYGIEGFLHWGFNFYYTQLSKEPLNPYVENDGGDSFQSGDPFIVYPGANGMPELSMRLFYMKEAMQDHRALTLLESMRGREFVVSLINEALKSPLTFDSFPMDEDYIWQLRQRVNSEIARALV